MRRTSLRHCALLAAVAAFGLTTTRTALGQNLFTNPSFETGDFTGWTVEPVGNVPTVMADDVAIDATWKSNVRTGNFAAVTAGGSFVSSIFSQTVAVQPDTTYLVGGHLSIARLAGNAAYSSNMVIDDVAATNSASVRFQLTSGDTPDGFTPVGRLYTAGPGQTSATFRLRILGTDPRVSLDDAYAQQWVAPVSSGGTTERFVTRDQPAPDGLDNVTTLFTNLLADGGLMTTASVPSGDFATFVKRPGQSTLAFRGGWAAPDGPGTASNISGIGINDAGDVLVAATLLDTGLPGSQRGHYVMRDGQPNAVVRIGQAAPGGGVFDTIGPSVLSESGGVAIYGRAGTTSDGVYVKPFGAAMIAIAREGDTAPRTTRTFADLTSNSAINASNQVAFQAALSSGSGVFFHDGTSLSAVALPGDLDDGGAAISGSFGVPVINDAGHIAFTSNGTTRLLRFNGATLHTVAAQSQAAPGGGSFDRFSPPEINNASQIAFIASLAGGGSGVYRASPGGSPVLIARTGQLRPDATGKTFANFMAGSATGSVYPPVAPAIAAGGQVAFVDYIGATMYDLGVYLGDGTETIEVTRWGHATDNGVVTETRWNNSPTIQLNDFGQVSYVTTYGDGSQSSVLFTPTLHYRSATSGNWSANTNWTVGLAPAAVHPVKIDSAAGVTVTGPAGNTTIKSLAVTAGNELALVAGSNLTVTDGLTLAGTLSGTGTITGDITSTGLISPGHSAGTITIEGDLASAGRIDFELLEGGFDQLIVNGTLNLTGDIFVNGAAGVGQTFNLILADAIAGTPTWHLPGESTFQFISLPGGGQGVQVTYVPEPTTGLLLATAVVPLARYRRRKIL